MREYCTICSGRGVITRLADGEVIDCGHCLGSGWRWVSVAQDVAARVLGLLFLVAMLAIERVTR